MTISENQDSLRRTNVGIFICAVSVLLFCVLSCPIVFATNYYVDSSASAGGDGLSEGTAWNTLAQVNASMGIFARGDHILLKRGSGFYNESLLINNLHGTAGTPIVFGAYGNTNLPLPVINGTKEVSWTAKGENIYSTPSSKPKVLIYKEIPKPYTTTFRLNTVPLKLTANGILIRVDAYANFWVRSIKGDTVSGITWMNFTPGNQVTYRYVENGKEKKSSDVLVIEEIVTTGTAADAGLTEWGDWYYDNGLIYLLAENNPNTSRAVQVPNADAMQFGTRSLHGIKVTSSNNVQIQDIQVQKFNNSGLLLLNSSYITVLGVNVYGCGGNGINIWNSSYNTIQNSIIDYSAGGISLYTQPGGNFKTIDNQIISNAISNSRGTGIALVRDKPGVDGGDVSGNIISGNIISNSTTMTYDNGGLYTFFAGPNTIKNNVIRNGGSTYLASSGIQIDMMTDFMTISGNTIENNSTGGVVVSGEGHKITNNTLRNNGAALAGRAQISFFYAGTHASKCIVTGNTIQADPGYNYILANTTGSCTGHTINNNNYRSEGRASGQFFWPCSSSKWMDFPTWQRLTGHDEDSTLSEVRNKVSSIVSNIFFFVAQVMDSVDPLKDRISLVRAIKPYIFVMRTSYVAGR